MAERFSGLSCELCKLVTPNHLEGTCMKKHLINLERLVKKLQERLGPDDELVLELAHELEKIRSMVLRKQP